MTVVLTATGYILYRPEYIYYCVPQIDSILYCKKSTEKIVWPFKLIFFIHQPLMTKAVYLPHHDPKYKITFQH